MVYDLYATPALAGQHGIRYETLDLADDLGLTCPRTSTSARPTTASLAAAEDAYFTAAGEAFWAEAERIARDRAAQHPGSQQPAQRGMNPGRAKARTPRPSSGKLARRSRLP